MKIRSALFDTNVLVAHLRRGLDIGEWSTTDSVWYASVVTEGELMHGVYRSQSVAKNEAHVRTLLRDFTVLPVTSDTAKRFASIAAELDAQGLPIPQNDLWIAAQALEYDLPLVTSDAHFHRVKNLQVLTW